MKLLKTDKVTLTVGGNKIEGCATTVELCEDMADVVNTPLNRGVTVKVSARVTYMSPEFKRFVDAVRKSRIKPKKRKRKP